MNNFYEKVEAGEFPAGMKVMVVDDDQQLLTLHENLLTQFAYHVTTCSQAKDALKLLREKKGCFDLIFVDFNIPDMDCCTLLKYIKEAMNLPSIMMLAGDEENISSIMRGIEHGACDFLIKPMSKEQVKNIWHHVASKKYTEKMELEGGRLKNNENGSSSNGATEEPTKSLKKRSSSEDESKNSDIITTKRPRFVWTEDRKQKFENAIKLIGLENAVPKKILQVMKDSNITRENVASHLQKYRLNLRKSEINDAPVAYHHPIEQDVRTSSSRMPHITNQSPRQPIIQESNQFSIQRSSSHLPQRQTKIFDRLTIVQSNNSDYHLSDDQNSYFGAHNRNTMMNMQPNWTQPHADFHIGYSHASTNGHHLPTTSYANNCNHHPRYFSNCMPLPQIPGGDVNNIGPLSGQPASGSLGGNVSINLLGGHSDSRLAHLLNVNSGNGQQVENSLTIETSTIIQQQPYRTNPGRGIDHESPTGLGFAGTEISNPAKVESNEHKVLMTNVDDEDPSFEEGQAITNGFLTSGLHVGFPDRQEFP